MSTKKTMYAKATAKTAKAETVKTATSEQPARSNAGLYAAGKRYAGRLARPAAGRRKTATVNDVAAESGVPPMEVKAATVFAAAVDRIAAQCGAAVRPLLLSDHPRLTAQTVKRIANTHPERQRYALTRARAGRDPLGNAADGTDPPFDTKGVGEVLNRLARNAGAVAGAADGLMATPATAWPPAGKVAAVLDHAVRVRHLVRQMTPVAKRSPTTPVAGGTRRTGAHTTRPGSPTSLDPPCVLRAVAGAVAVTEKNARQLARTLAETPPTAGQKAALLDRLAALAAAADRLIAVVRSHGHDPRTGPAAVPGTYVVVYRLTADVRGLTVGGLGTFDFPAGHYAYLGSAFGGGGVRARTHRHLTVETPRKWNVDHLKPLCVPVAVWWTYDRRKVEFDWAAALAGMPGAAFPARRFGAADNPGAEAHLVHFRRPPSAARFRRLVASAVPAHAPVHGKEVDGWAGRGWAG